jgi:hypothetical protein
VFGALQTSQNLAHGHTVTDPGHTHTYNINGGDFISGTVITTYALNDSTLITQKASSSNTTGITINNDGGAEARPHNIALLPCIKF